MTSRKQSEPADEPYELPTFVHVSQLEGYDPAYGLPTVVSPLVPEPIVPGPTPKEK